jgi:hypothetical protein
MANFKTLSLVGVMLVSTAGVAVAETPTPLTFTVCCPTNVPQVSMNQCGSNGNCFGTFTDSAGYMWNVIPQPTVAEGTIVNVKSPPTSLALDKQFVQCNYNGSTSTVSSLKINLINFSLQNCNPLKGQTCVTCPATENNMKRSRSNEKH